MPFRSRRKLAVAAALIPLASAQLANTFVYVGDAGVSAQQLFLGAPHKLYFVDKTENNPLKIKGHPAWASEVDTRTWTARPMDIATNAFCAGGTVLGDGTWLNVGGNQAVVAGGVGASDGQGAAPDAQKGDNMYGNADGRKAVRTLLPTDDGTAEWIDDPDNYLPHERWYPTLETLEDGRAIIFGGCQNGGYVNDANQDNPTYEFFPKDNSGLTTLGILQQTLPVNLYPLVWLLPSGNIFIQSGWQAVVFDYKNKAEYPLANIPDAVRVYPASAATTVLPMTPANNWTASILFCGGTNLQNTDWDPTNRNIVQVPTERSCVKIQPDVDSTWYQEDALDEGRSMGQFINLPDGRLFFVNGCGQGTAGYGNQSWAIGQSYGDVPRLTAYYFDASQDRGKRWSTAGSSTTARMYHSSAVLLPDGSVVVSGSNPNADFVSAENPPTTPNNNYKYFSETSIEVFYPDYWDKPRPAPANMPSTITYGGDSFDIELSKADLADTTANIARTKAVIIRTGFSTHALNMGQRHVELQVSFSTNELGGATLHVAQLPPNPAILAPGPAMFFVVVNGVPSNASWVMIGDGKVGQQNIGATSQLPVPTWSQEVADQATQLKIKF
ncbi:hypothetical protein CcaverHIS002_0409340 [Cutaneotrichosporon cavernicola]|uniref:Glyoxal oxidase n=1 Tax=Cutaneotrichosporon cavernicola TaxID=279322 RepID=A0AA48L549_9TREE|nr:uncharacterized protein CcaverHIS019_0409270 [Cutaneotrichosporon cavernicola]BEI84330.1 hypothetical protein CcaverHIS002_0409340 [Cutaneotrichosporon cavernicola]BEI92107.1 hypothetical protein CcaverHIS019_0409270 [Cutaneotrichosporon cavernicola]BEI99877.1 hypothetical protein CcaverHIS631_0409200 [Cutaneotrichosporon cavernicola]BEJ07652.1 hypothetical protein CcaverHIS641_0409210 [Cutaneotrichosporon cavernicola]